MSSMVMSCPLALSVRPVDTHGDFDSCSADDKYSAQVRLVDGLLHLCQFSGIVMVSGVSLRFPCVIPNR